MGWGLGVFKVNFRGGLGDDADSCRGFGCHPHGLVLAWLFDSAHWTKVSSIAH